MTSTMTPPRGGILTAEPGFVVSLDGFDGPLDLLLHLVREDEIDIANIPIARIADQFLRVIHALGLNQAADYLEMAGRLLRLKAQMLLPRHEGEEWEDPRAELVRRLLEYQQVKEIALWMGRAAERRSQQHARGWLPPPSEGPPPLPLTLEITDLLVAVEQVIFNIPSPVLHRVVPRPLDVEGALVRIEALLAERAEFDWREAFGNSPTVVAVLSTLLALLELARRGRVRVAQPQPFAPLVITREQSESALAAS
ncbi:MAG TPA: segregation/condensation protein A [Gemmatimonadales bacterium]|nr:segregation/condensation protein A [Gemmatimonadales bacterium]